MKIAITNIVVLNGGDGAILFGMMKVLRAAFGRDTEFSVFCSQPLVAGRLFPGVRFQETLGLAACRTRFSRVRYLGRLARMAKRWRYQCVALAVGRGLAVFSRLLPRDSREALADYASSDLVILGGGTYLKDEYGIESQICDCQIAAGLRKPLVFFTQSIGPLRRADSRRLFQQVLGRVDCILVRDQVSADCVRGFKGPIPPLYQCADAAFALGDGRWLRAREPAAPRNRVAVSVRQWPWFSRDVALNYRAAVARACEWLLARGFDVTFLSTCQGNPEYTDDAEEADEIVKLLPREARDRIVVSRGFIRYDAFMRQIGSFDFVIATRLHVAILSLISGVPVLPVAYEFKTVELFRQLGLVDWVTEMESIQADALVAMVERFVRCRGDLVGGGLFARVADLCDDAFKAGGYLKQHADPLHR
jgi:colanic acid/amylovoran biosynthesis protein